MANLPTKIRVDIRDHFSASTSSVQKAFKSLAATIGYELVCSPEWAQLWNEVEDIFPDKSTFVPNVTGLITAWCEVLDGRLEDDRFTSWTEELLEKLETGRVVKLLLVISDESRARTSWLSQTNSFGLVIPKKTVIAPSRASSGFQSDFENLFNKDAEDPRNSIAKDDDWAAVDEMGEAQSLSIGTQEIQPDSLPAVETLARPDILFNTLAPLTVHVTLSSSSKIVVNATHEPTLRLIADYFKRWTKVDNRDIRKVPIVNVTLYESHFGLGLSYDTLVIEAHDSAHRYVELNLTPILGFLEGVLGYKIVHRPSGGWGGPWELKREVGFKV